MVASDGAVPSWAARMEGSSVAAAAPSAERLRTAASVWIDGSMEQALEVAAAVHRADATVQVGIVAAAEDRSAIQRRLLFTPGVGEVWIVLPDEVDRELVDRAAEVTRSRRSYRTTRHRFAAATQGLAGLPSRATVTDAYLAALLEVLPDPVISLDEEDLVVTWSPAAERVLGRPASAAVGRPLGEVLAAEPPEALQALLAEARSGVARRELRVSGDPPLILDGVATPVVAGGVQGRALVLRDVTRERQSIARVEAAMATRSRFFASMSHELRTPINAILGYNDLLLSGVLGEVAEDHLRHLERSQTAARHLLELVNDVLDLSKLEAGKIELRFEQVVAGDLLDELASTLEPLAEQNGTVLRQACEDPQARFTTDPRRLRQILLNLVSNAVKFGEGRPVLLRCRRDPEAVILEVEDQGRGIAPEDQERIFEEFAQVGSSDQGTGLGLSISRRLADALGGTLTVESEPGAGSTFRLRLPLEPPSRAATSGLSPGDPAW